MTDSTKFPPGDYSVKIKAEIDGWPNKNQSVMIDLKLVAPPLDCSQVTLQASSLQESATYKYKTSSPATASFTITGQ